MKKDSRIRKSSKATRAAVLIAAGLFLVGVMGCQSGSDEALEMSNAPWEEADAAIPAASSEPAKTPTDGEWVTIPDDYDPDADEWPGASLGFVGPNGEGAVRGSDYETNEEYQKALSGSSSIENPVPSDVREAPDGTLYEEGALSIGFAPSVSEYDAHVLVEERGGIWILDDYRTWSSEMVDTLGFVGACVHFTGVSGYDALLDLAADLEELPEVVFASPPGLDMGFDDVGDEGLADGSDEASRSTTAQTYLSLSRFDRAWTLVKCSGRATIGVIDVGFDLDHPDLRANFLGCWNAAESCLMSSDPYNGDHGTMVCGVASAVAGNDVGIEGCSYNAKLMPVSRATTSQIGSVQAATMAARYLAECPVKPDVVNMSFGWYQEDLGSSDRAYLGALGIQLETLRAAGVTLVATAGNDRCAQLRYPASFEGVISVASVTSAGERSDFSNYNAEVDISAMGTDVYSTTNPDINTRGLSCDYNSGTSFAAPQVAAVAALLKVQNPEWNPSQIETRLEREARDLGASGRDNYFGWGLLDAAAAVGWEEPSSPDTAASIYDDWAAMAERKQ